PALCPLSRHDALPILARPGLLEGRADLLEDRGHLLQGDLDGHYHDFQGGLGGHFDHHQGGLGDYQADHPGHWPFHHQRACAGLQVAGRCGEVGVGSHCGCHEAGGGRFRHHLRVDQVRRQRRGGPCVQVDLDDRVHCLQGGRGDHHLGMEQHHHAHLPVHWHCYHQRCDPSV